MRSHEWIDRRSLALHGAVAAKLEQHPELLEVARGQLEALVVQQPDAGLTGMAAAFGCPFPRPIAHIAAFN